MRISKHKGVKGRKISPGLFKLESESRKDRFLIPLPNINPSCLFDCLGGWLVGWLRRWLFVCLFGWLAGVFVCLF